VYIQTHWQTICLDFKLKIIYVGNGNTSFGDITDELLFTLLYDVIYVFNLESIDKSIILELITQWKIIRPDFILQDDCCSCGPIAIIFAILFAFDIEIETTLKQQLVITNDMMTNIRIKIASSLLSQRSFFALDYLLGINTNLSKTIEQIILKTKDSMRVRNISDNDIQKKEIKNENFGSFRKNNKGLITTKNNLSNIYLFNFSGDIGSSDNTSENNKDFSKSGDQFNKRKRYDHVHDIRESETKVMNLGNKNKGLITIKTIKVICIIF
jgi:hypothetical protein